MAKGYLVGSYLLGLEDPGEPHGPPRRPAHVPRAAPAGRRAAGPEYQAVDHAAVRRVIERVLGEPRTVAAVGPRHEAALRRSGAELEVA